MFFQCVCCLCAITRKHIHLYIYTYTYTFYITVRIHIFSFLNIATQLLKFVVPTVSLYDIYSAGKTLIHPVLGSDSVAVEAAVKTNSPLQHCTVALLYVFFIFFTHLFLSSSQSHTETDKHPQSHAHLIYSVQLALHACYLGLWENLDRTHEDTGRTCNLHTQRSKVALNRSFLCLCFSVLGNMGKLLVISKTTFHKQ